MGLISRVSSRTYRLLIVQRVSSLIPHSQEQRHHTSMSRNKKEQVLQIDPPSDLQFNGDFTSQVCRTKLTLTNPTEIEIAYKVKTTAPRRYCVRPNSGKIMPTESATVSIMLQPAQNNDDLNKHKFMVQAIEVNESNASVPVDDLFKSTPSEDVMSKKLYCSFSTDEVVGQSGETQSTVVEKETSLGEPPAYGQDSPVKVEKDFQAEEGVSRPVISAVPTEPEIINPVVQETHQEHSTNITSAASATV